MSSLKEEPQIPILSEMVDFSNLPIGIDTVRARFPLHQQHEYDYYCGPKLEKLQMDLDWLYGKLVRTSAAKVGTLDQEFLRDLGFGWMVKEFDIFSAKADYDYSGEFPIPYLNFRKKLGEEIITLETRGWTHKKVKPVDVGFKVYLPGNAPPSLLIETSLQTAATGSLTNLTRNISYARELKKLTTEAKDFFLRLCIDHYGYPFDYSGWWMLIRLDLMSDAINILDRSEVRDFINILSRFRLEGYQRHRSEDGYKVKFIPNIRGKMKVWKKKKRVRTKDKKWIDAEQFREIDIPMFKHQMEPDLVERRHKLPHLNIYNKTVEIKEIHGCLMAENVIRNEQQFYLESLKSQFKDHRNEFARTGSIETLLDDRKKIFKEYNAIEALRGVRPLTEKEYIYELFQGNILKAELFLALRDLGSATRSQLQKLLPDWDWKKIQRQFKKWREIGYVTLKARRYYQLTNYALNTVLYQERT